MQPATLQGKFVSDVSARIGLVQVHRTIDRCQEPDNFMRTR